MNPAIANILIIDDEPGIRDLLSRELALQGYRTDAAANGPEAMEKLGQAKFSVALCDMNMPKMGGLDVLAELHKRDPEIEVIMMTGYATIESAVEAMKRGAYDFVQKPFNLVEILALVTKSLEKGELRRTIHELRETKKKLEETQAQLIQSEKLAGIGQLAAGVAHELNNPLSGVIGFSQLLLEDSTLNAQQRQDIETIRAQSQRCRVIIQNLLQFCRRSDPATVPIDLRQLMQATLDLVHYDFTTSGVEISAQLPPSLPLVLGDPNQLQQVFLNLITNARQAMEAQKQGKMTLAGEHKNDRVYLYFNDNGPGIAPDVVGKIFDPFFTTKPVGKGTGLGLSICYGIVQQHRGSICVESRPGKGTFFTVELPAMKETSSSTGPGVQVQDGATRVSNP